MQYVTEIRKLDPDAMVLSIIDDVETVCDGVKVPRAKTTDLLNKAMAPVRQRVRLQYEKTQARGCVARVCLRSKGRSES